MGIFTERSAHRAGDVYGVAGGRAPGLGETMSGTSRVVNREVAQEGPPRGGVGARSQESSSAQRLQRNSAEEEEKGEKN